MMRHEIVKFVVQAAERSATAGRRGLTFETAGNVWVTSLGSASVPGRAISGSCCFTRSLLKEPGAAQAQARYIAGPPEVNHHGHRALGQSRITARTSTRLLLSVMILSAAMGTETHPARRHASSGYYGTYLPPERTTATMFAPCLLGCRGAGR